MSKSMLRTLGALIAAGTLALTGCSNGSSQTGATPASSAATKEYKIGVTQIVTHASLDATRTGFKKALADAGIKATYDEQNAQDDQATSTSIANKFKDAKLDLILAISTPSAQSTAQVITDVPILFTAVTDPVAAQLVTSNEAPGANVSGTTDMNPVAEQIALIKQIKPDAKSVGIVYSSGEVNSAVQVEMARKAAAEQGLSVVEKTITNTSEVQQAANSLNTDSIYVPTDNKVVSAIDAVLQAAEKRKIPLIVGEGDSVKKGGLATIGIDYEKLGYQTGQMAVKVLKGEAKPESMPVEAQKEFVTMVNTTAAERMGLTIPQALLDKATVIK